MFGSGVSCNSQTVHLPQKQQRYYLASVKCHAAFKVLNYITDNIVRAALTTLLCVFLWERAGEKWHVLSVHNTITFVSKTWKYIQIFVSYFFIVFISPVSVFVCFGSLAVVICKDF